MACCTVDFPVCWTRYSGPRIVYTFEQYDGTLYDISTWDFEFEVRTSDGTAVFSLTPGAGLTVDTVTATVTAQPTSNQTALLTAGLTYFAGFRADRPTLAPYFPPMRYVISVRTPEARP